MLWAHWPLHPKRPSAKARWGQGLPSPRCHLTFHVMTPSFQTLGSPANPGRFKGTGQSAIRQKMNWTPRTPSADGFL